MCRCYIITSYIDGDPSVLIERTETDYVICADNGYCHGSLHGILPDVIIGDFDSLKMDLPQGIKVIQLPIQKDDTDTLACVKYAINYGYKEIVIIGGIGGRLDHTLANLQCLSYGLDCGVQIELRDAHNRVRLHLPSTISIPAEEAFFLSMFSFTETCQGVTTTGLKYPLKDALLNQSFPLGISNEFASDIATVSFTTGKLLIILSKD